MIDAAPASVGRAKGAARDALASAPEEPPAVHAVDLVKRYDGKTVVDGVTLRIRPGCVFSIVGPNGAGKTTTLEMIEGIRRPTRGQVQILGKDVHRAGPDVRERIGVLPQNAAMFERLTARENIEYFAGLYRRPLPIEDVMATTGLGEWSSVRYHRLSGGLKQRVAIAAALVNDPEVLFLDEPTAGLDPVARRGLWDLVTALRKRKTTIVLTTHYMDEAEELSDVVCFLLGGRVLEEGHPQDLILRYGGERSLRLRGLTPQELHRALSLDLGAAGTADGTLTVPIARTSELGRVLSALGEAAVPTREAVLREPSLDDVFIALATGGTGGASG